MHYKKPVPWLLSKGFCETLLCTPANNEVIQPGSLDPLRKAENRIQEKNGFRFKFLRIYHILLQMASTESSFTKYFFSSRVLKTFTLIKYLLIFFPLCKSSREDIFVTLPTTKQLLEKAITALFFLSSSLTKKALRNKY